MNTRTLLVAGLAVGGLAAVPASASAITITPLGACQVVDGSTGIRAVVANGTPGGAVTVSGPAGTRSGTLDAAGRVLPLPFDFGAPSFSLNPSKGRTATLTALDGATGQSAIVRTKYTRAASRITSGTRTRGASRRWRVSGLRPITGKKSVYVSWLRRGKVVRRVRLAVSRNSCGYISVQRSADPGSKIGGRTFTLRIHSQTRYSSSKPYIRAGTYTRIG